jgi:ArsR family transcriptional regulator, arsenate/arsenite/antimonite-responsive transcriptional repressor
MSPDDAIGALSALAHPGRLQVFRLLVRAGPLGLAAGRIAQQTGSLPNTLSTNLNILAGAGLVRARREGRSVIYVAGYDRMSDLLAYLMEDCCAGNPSICGPLVDVAERARCAVSEGAC